MVVELVIHEVETLPKLIQSLLAKSEDVFEGLTKLTLRREIDDCIVTREGQSATNVRPYKYDTLRRKNTKFSQRDATSGDHQT